MKTEITEFIHMRLLGILCEKIGEPRMYAPMTTMRPREVTCPRCIKIMYERGILR